MRNFICAESGGSSIVVYVILIVALVAMLILPYFTQRKRNKEFLAMIESMKVGDLVKTAGGIIGKITKITDKGDIKTVILETGSKSQKSYMEFDMSMIYCVLKSTKVEMEEKVEEASKEEMVETKTEEPANVESNPAVEQLVDEKKPEAKKAPAKKKSATTKKSTTSKK